ncbi:MuF-like minor capsid protein [Microbacterium phage Floof]|uniref:MuF-like minor capsid protein n=1 Tax=Microbacterium phage Floof TaxID=2201433 RepID=A0A2Z4Q478_9CAUD|nr:MuF-like minor capsid protein [Microbacterium phage Floof]
MASRTNAAVAMARSHQVDQVRQAAFVQTALAALWDETLDPNDITRSFLTFREKAVALITTGRLLSERKATDYYLKLLASKGLDASDLADFAPDIFPDTAIKASLSGATGKHLNKAYFLNQRDLPNSAVLALAKADMLGSAKRQILNASRSHLVALSRHHRKIKGWARVSDGAPCSFCAMLIARGPVYAEDTAGFDAHDRCGCSVRLVTYDEPDDGWTDDARRYRDAYAADQRAVMRSYFEERGEPVPDRYQARPGEESFAEIMRKRATDKQRARRKRDRARQLQLAA